MTGHPIVVLAGGLSHERDVSLRSGRRTAEALRSAGLDVAERDVDSGLLAALLAMVGVFGVMTYNVRRQRREIGIRLALGAERAVVRRLIVTRGLRLAVLGSLAGALGAYLLTGTLQTMLNDVTPNDPLVFGGTAAVILTAALLASWLPARAAGKTDPMVALRD